MKKIIMISMVVLCGLIACDTPSPATQNPDQPSEQIPQPDSAKLDSTRAQR